MKKRKKFEAARLCFPVILLIFCAATSLGAQEKPKSPLPKQENERFLANPGSAVLFPGFEQTLPKRKSEKTALVLSLAGTLVPIAAGTSAWAKHGFKRDQLGRYYASGPVLFYYRGPSTPIAPFGLIASGAIFGPSLGYLYGGLPERGLDEAARRYGIFVGTIMAAQAAQIITTWRHTKPRVARQIISGISIAGGGLLLITAAIDVAKTPGSVQKRNRILQARTLSVTPAFFAQHGAPGLNIQLQF